MMNMTIGKKLGAAFGLLILLMAMSAAIVYSKVAEMDHHIHQVIEEATPTVRACDAILNSMNESVALFRGYLILGSDDQLAGTFKSERVQAWQDIHRELEQLRELSATWEQAKDRQDLQRIESELGELEKLQHDAEAVAHTDQNIPSLHLLQTKGEPLMEQMLKTLSSMMAEEQALDASPQRRALLTAMADNRIALATAREGMSSYLLTGKADFKGLYDKAWQEARHAYDAASALEPVMTASQRAHWSRYGALRAEFEPLAGSIIAQRGEADWNRASHLMKFELLPRVRQVRESLEGLSASADERVAQRRAALIESSRAVTLTLISATLLAVLVGSVVAVFLSRRIVSAIQTLVGRAQAVAEGNLSGEDLRVSSRDEVGQLADVFNHMVRSLRDLAGQTRQVSQSISSNAAQILSSTKQQAAGTREQAATVQQITSTMQEINQSGEQIGDKAKQVAASTEATQRASSSGAQAAQSTNLTMDSIREQVEEVAENIVALSEKTQTIGEIVATVTDIAEQSNLLALNASIEAVSAGEQGGRFGVVANEMKNLADQAKESTVQVRTILSDIQKGINTSVMLTEEAVKRVDAGKQQADLMEQTIREMSESTSRSVQAFEQIAGGASQQLIGFDQVTQGMKDISKASEQTASAIGQLESAAMNLNALGEQLQATVRRYQV